MGNCRFLYDNLLTATMFSCGTAYQKKGIVTAPYKEGVGSAELTCYGNYKHYEDLEYLVQISATGVSSGHEVGSAKFDWADGVSWDATGVVTSNSTIDLSHGTKIYFSSGAGNDFEIGDNFYFKGINPFKPGNLVDGNLDTKWKTRTEGTFYSLYMNLGSLSSVNAFAMANHNFTSNTTIWLGYYDSSAYSTILGASTFPWSSGLILHYFSSMTTAQHWALCIETSSGYSLEAGEMFLGRYWEPSDNFAVDSQINKQLVSDIQYTRAGVRKENYQNQKTIINLSFPYMKTTDKEAFESMMEMIGDSTSHEYKPVFFNMDSSITTQTWLMKVNPLSITQHKARFSIQMQMEEVLKSV